MRTSISFNLTKEESAKTHELAKSRGFETTSDYLRFLINQDDTDLISEHELIKRSQEVDRFHKSGKLIKAKSLADLMK
ncbi:MAG: hypothetical protein WCJ29_01600 [bacterium]